MYDLRPTRDTARERAGQRKSVYSNMGIFCQLTFRVSATYDLGRFAVTKTPAFYS